MQISLFVAVLWLNGLPRPATSVDLRHRDPHLPHPVRVFGLEAGKGCCLEGKDRQDGKELDFPHTHYTVSFQSSGVL